MSDAPTYIAIHHVMHRFTIGRATVYRWMEDPNIKFPRPKKFGGAARWSLAEIQAWEHKRGANG